MRDGLKIEKKLHLANSDEVLMALKDVLQNGKLVIPEYEESEDVHKKRFLLDKIRYKLSESQKAMPDILNPVVKSTCRRVLDICDNKHPDFDCNDVIEAGIQNVKIHEAFRALIAYINNGAMYGLVHGNDIPDDQADRVMKYVVMSGNSIKALINPDMLAECIEKHGSKMPENFMDDCQVKEALKRITETVSIFLMGLNKFCGEHVNLSIEALAKTKNELALIINSAIKNIEERQGGVRLK